MFAPTVQAQGIKFPSNGALGTGVTAGDGYQFRAALSWSPLDFYKGFQVKSVGTADCQQHEVVVSVREVLTQAGDYGRLPALKKQVAYLDEAKTECDRISAKSEERVAAHVSSIHDSAEVRGRITHVMRSRERSQGEIDRLQARGVEAFRGSLTALVSAAERETMAFEKQASHVRSLDAWDFRVTGGVVPQVQPVDYFGVVQIGFNFGAFSHNAQESRYLSARADELTKARYELRAQVEQFRAHIKSTAAQARRELTIVEKQSAMLAADKAAIESADSANAAQALALITLDSILVESERVYLTNLTAELARLENDNVR
jgi:hypothetical protein